MKKETIIWQIIILLLGALLIFTLREYFIDKNIITARTNQAECHMNGYKTTEVISERQLLNNLCWSIVNFKEK